MSWVTNSIVRPSAAQPRELVEALLLERRVADREHLVDQQDVGVDLDRGREREPDVHARGVVLELEVDELLELGEREDVVEPLAASLRESPSMIALMITLSRAVRSGLNPTPSSMNGDSRPLIGELAVVDVVDPGEAFEQRALAAAVAPDDPEELPGGDLDADVLDGAQDVELRARERVQRPLLERVVLLVRQAERLADVLDRNCRPRRSRERRAVRVTLLAQDRAHAADGSNGAASEADASLRRLERLHDHRQELRRVCARPGEIAGGAPSRQPSVDADHRRFRGLPRSRGGAVRGSHPGRHRLRAVHAHGACATRCSSSRRR